MSADILVTPVVGELSDTSTPDDFEIARRRAAMFHLSSALGLWPNIDDLTVWLFALAVEAWFAHLEEST